MGQCRTDPLVYTDLLGARDGAAFGIGDPGISPLQHQRRIEQSQTQPRAFESLVQPFHTALPTGLQAHLQLPQRLLLACQQQARGQPLAPGHRDQPHALRSGQA